MRIAHLNISDMREGISGTIRTLIDAQKEQGHSPCLYSQFRRSQDEEVRLLPIDGGVGDTALHLFEQREGITGLSSMAVKDLWRDPDFAAADLVHLHVTSAGFLSWLLFPALAAKPLVWSVYESQPYTAGCFHTVMCNRWQQQCKDCPLVDKEKKARQEELYRLKQAIFDLVPMAVATPNSWLTGQVKSSMLSARFAAEIPLAIDAIFFRRVNRQDIRQRLAIHQEAFVIAFAAPKGLEDSLYGGVYVRQVFDRWRENNQNVVLLQLGASDQEPALSAPFVQIKVPYGLPPEQRSAVLQAADVFIQLSPHDAAAVNLLEASAAGVAPVAFPVAGAGAQIRHLETGYLTSSNSIDEIVRGLTFLRGKPDFVKILGEQAARRVMLRHQPQAVAAAYQDLYARLRLDGGRSWKVAVASQAMPPVPRDGASLQDLLQSLEIEQRVDRGLREGMETLWRELEVACLAYPAERAWERGVFVDLFLTFVLQRVPQPMAPMLLIDVISQWMQRRGLPQRCGAFCPTEKLALQHWTRALRIGLENFLRATPPEFFVHLTTFQQGRLIDLWRTLFFNDFATPYLEEEMHLEERRRIEGTTSPRRIYPDLLIRSLYTPYPPESVKLDMVRLLKNDVPIALQVILAFWIVNVPYYDGDEKRQRIMRRNAAAFLQGAMQDPQALPPHFFNGIVEHVVPQYWRAAYLGGNLLKEISLLGDFLYQQMCRLQPRFVERIAPKPLVGDRRLRIGYVSSNFCHQAVSYYMANRIFHADKQKFEVFVFSLEKRHDTMTDRIKGFSDRFIAFNEFRNLANLADTIRNSELDVLIYADIGMDQISYQLAAMRLAPVQCVLVGHGVTTGLPTMDYYLSGDFESPRAQEHYREQLIRLPNLGAAQLPPPFPPTGKMTRKSLGLPEDAVLLVSCANGIKHGPDRDALLIKILQQAPQAIIILKPFMNPELIQPQWSHRVQAAARQAGVADRLRIIPPLAQGKDLMDFLAMADIQLDTYPYGGWTTNMEAVYAGLAIVTQEGEQARSRWGAHILRALGVQAGIASNEREYVQQAVALVKNHELRNQIRQQIRERAQQVLFNGAAAQPAYEQVLLKIHQETLAKWSQEAKA